MEEKYQTIMKIHLSTLFLCFSIAVIGQNPLLVISNGKIEGTYNADKTVRSFKAVPYAMPPNGPRRWKAPQPVNDWAAIRNCTAYSASAMQPKPVPFMCWSEEFIAPPEPLSEDCLFLNIWTSAKEKTEKKDRLPVFVWIHGGALTSGAASCAVYDGEEMAKKGVVFVSINYRLGVFGYMAHTELSTESGNKASGNYGFLDQIEALKWIKKNIEDFGGDPKNVTIAGQSAGSFSVNALVASPLAKGLFQRAIAESGALFSRPLKTLDEGETQGDMLMQKCLAKNIGELRQVPAEKLLEISNGKGMERFGSIADGYVLPKDLKAHFENAKHNDVPLLTGWVTGDGSLVGNTPTSVEKFQNMAKEKYGDKAADFLKIFAVSTDEEAKLAQSRLGMCQFAALPSHIWAGFNKKSKAFLYQFSHVPPDKPNFPNYGAFHTSEVPYALHTLKMWQRSWQKTDTDLEKTMSDYWVNFAKTGDPNGAGLPEWKSYDKETSHIMELGDKVELKTGGFKATFEFLEKVK
jgi:para-nitrobenzyl esterase